MKMKKPMSSMLRVLILINLLLLIPKLDLFGQLSSEIKTDADLYKAIKWSLPTNGVQVGLLLIPDGSTTGRQDYRITLALYGISTNRIIVWFPPEEQRYSFDLTDGEGEHVKRTSRGKRIGQPMSRKLGNLQSRGYRVSWVHGGDLDRVMPEVRLSDFFEFKNQGALTLKAKVQALVLVKEDRLVPVTFDLPPIQLNRHANHYKKRTSVKRFGAGTGEASHKGNGSVLMNSYFLLWPSGIRVRAWGTLPIIRTDGF